MVSCRIQGCKKFDVEMTDASLAQHNFGKHGGAQPQVGQFATGTRTDQRGQTPGRGRRGGRGGRGAGAARNRPQPSGSGTVPQTAAASETFVPAPPTFVMAEYQSHVFRGPGTTVTLSTRLAGRSEYSDWRKTGKLGQGTGNTINETVVVKWSGMDMNGTTITVPYAVKELVGLRVRMTGVGFGNGYGTFKLVYLSCPNGDAGISGRNTQTGTASSEMRNNLMALARRPNNVRGLVVISGLTDEVFIPVETGGTIYGAAEVNVVVGTNVLGANACLVEVDLAAVFAVSGDRL